MGPRSFFPSLALGLFICGAAYAATPDLITSFSFVGKYAAIGGTAGPNIYVYNVSTQTEDVTLTYTMPQGTTFTRYFVVRGTPTCSTPAVGANGNITCHATMGAGGQFQIAVAEVIDGGIAAGTTLTHAATVTGTNANGALQPASASASSVAQPAPTAALTFDYPATAVSGAAFTYHVTVTNTGSVGGPVYLFQSVDEQQASWWPDSLTQTSGPPFTCSTQLNDICSASSFPPGAAATFAITLRTYPLQTAPITVRNSLTFSDYAYTPATDAHVMNFTQSADTNVAISGGSIARIGDDIPYVVTVLDNGPSGTDGTLSITLPPGLAFASYSTGTYAPPQCTAPAVGASGTLTCTTTAKLYPPVPQYSDGGLGLRITVHVRPTSIGTLPITASFATSDATDPNGGDNSASTNVTVTEFGQADLAVTLKADKTAALVNTDTVTYDATATNKGPSTASNVKVTLTTPGNATIAPAPPGCSGQPLVCTVSTMPAGQTAHWRYTLHLAQTGSNVSSVTATSDSVDPDTTNNIASVTVTARVVTGDLRLHVTPSKTSANPGDEIGYSIDVSNSGPDVVPQATLTMTLPSGSVLLSSSYLCAQNGNVVTCSLPNIGPVNGTLLSLSAAAPAASAPFVVPFSVTGNVADPDLTNDNVTITTPISGAVPTGDADVTVSVTSEASVPAKGSAHFVVTAVNHGPATATNVTARFQLSGTNVMSTGVRPPDGNIHCVEYLYAGLDCVAPSLAPGASFSFSEVVTGVPVDGIATGTARIAAGTNDPNLSNNAATAVSVFAGPQVHVSVTPAEATAAYDASATHTITVTNTGDAADAVQVTESWLAGFAFTTLTPSSGSCTINGKSFTCNVGALAAGAQATITVTGKAVTLGVWSSSIRADVPLSGSVGAATSTSLNVVAAPHHRTAQH